MLLIATMNGVIFVVYKKWPENYYSLSQTFYKTKTNLFAMSIFLKLINKKTDFY